MRAIVEMKSIFLHSLFRVLWIKFCNKDYIKFISLCTS